MKKKINENISLSESDLKLAKKYGYKFKDDNTIDVTEGDIIFEVSQLAAFLAERDTQYKKELTDLKADIEGYIAENVSLVDQVLTLEDYRKE